MRVFTMFFLFVLSYSAILAQHNIKSLSSKKSINDGKQVYNQYCLSCHQADGMGVPNMNPPLTNTSYVKGDKTRLIKVILNGFVQNVDIDGESYSNNMPPHNFLSDRQIADVLTFVRNGFGNNASAVSSEQVKRLRNISPKQ